jgi:two-component system, cell cycle sensor histidine kinase and response regulator CckA
LTGQPPPPDDCAELARLRLELARLARENAELRARAIFDEELGSDAARYEVIVSNLAEGVVLQRAGGQILTCNSAAERILGLSYDQMAGRSSMDPRWRSIHEDGSPFPGDTHPAMVSLRTGEPLHDVIMGVHKPDGSLTWISINSQPLFRPEQPEPYAVVTSFVDITARKSLEDQLQLSRRMETVGRLAGGVAHDFNNLLTAILGCADLASIHAQIPSEVRDALDTIREAAEKAAGLTRQLLTFARKQVFDLEVFELRELVADLERLLSRLIGENIRMQVELGDVDLLVRADRAQIEQMLINLAVNARDAMPRGGDLHIAIANETIDTEIGALVAGRYAVIEFRDRGQGIAKAELPRIFDPFFTTKKDGTGLGLSTCYGIVKQLGGDILVESEIGVGTRFLIYLPLTEERLVPAPRDAVAPVKPGRGRILLAEDDPVVRLLAERGLQARGYEVVAVSDGPAAIEHLSGQPDAIDLLVSDVVMPNMTGYELAEQLRRLAPALKILFVSGYDQGPLEREEARQSITDAAYLPKPYTVSRLGDVIGQLLER